ncbi:uncharacterized protein CBL_20131 [Carabus blaptoides fortunei]
MNIVGPVIKLIRGELSRVTTLPRTAQRLWNMKPELKDNMFCLVDKTGGACEYRVIVPRALVNDILRIYHGNAALGAHLGVNRTLVKLRDRYYWPNMQSDVERWCRDCEDCCRRKAPTVTPRTPLLTDSSSRPLERKSWDVELPHVMMAYRASKHESTKYTPFSLMFGREIRLPIDVQYGLPPNMSCTSDQTYIRKLRASLDKAHETMRERLNAAHQRQKAYYDKKVKFINYAVGDTIWLHQSTPRIGESSKLHRPWTGPYRIIKDMGMNTFRIQHCALRHKRLVTHQDRFKPCAKVPNPEQARREERATRKPGRPRTKATGTAFKLEEVRADLFSSPSEYALAHCVAEDLKMTAGIALEFRKRYGGINLLRTQNIRPGNVAFLQPRGRFVFYLITKKESRNKPTYLDFTNSLYALRNRMKQFGVQKLAIPILGCGLDELQEYRVKDIIRDVFKDTDVTIRIFRKDRVRRYTQPPPTNSESMREYESSNSPYHSPTYKPSQESRGTSPRFATSEDDRSSPSCHAETEHEADEMASNAGSDSSDFSGSPVLNEVEDDPVRILENQNNEVLENSGLQEDLDIEEASREQGIVVPENTSEVSDPGGGNPDRRILPAREARSLARLRLQYEISRRKF